MEIAISEARRRLPELVHRVKTDAGLRIRITVHGEVVAELRAPLPEPKPGAAAERLRALMAEMPAHRGRKRKVSANVGEALYGKKRK